MCVELKRKTQSDLMSKAYDDESTIQRAQEGDRAALGHVLFAAYDDLASFLSPRIPALLKNTVSSDDIIQQTFAKAFTDVSSFEWRGPGSFTAWLRMIADHRLQDAIKGATAKKRGGDRVRVQGTENATTSAADVMAMIAGDDPTASRVLRHQEAEQAVRLAISQLPADYSMVIKLRYFELRSIAETAEIMQRSEASIRALTDRAKKQLRDDLGRISMYLSER